MVKQDTLELDSCEAESPGSLPGGEKRIASSNIIRRNAFDNLDRVPHRRKLVINTATVTLS